MKKLLLATLLSLSSAMTLANAVDPFAGLDPGIAFL